MASSIPVSRSINLASQFNRNAPLILLNNDPALSNADWVRQFTLGPPFGWRWNRSTAPSILLDIGITDYPTALTDFGWIEKANLLFPVPSGGQGKSIELQVVDNLAQEVTINEPISICAFLDNDSGNINFRILPAPDQQYTLQVIYQKSSPTFSTTSDTWFPIPDYFSYLYNQGMLAKTYEYLGDERYAGSMIMFLRQVIAANQGLTDNQKNLFLADHVATIKEQQNALGAAQSARTGRGGFQG